MDHVSMVVDDLGAAVAFFTALGLTEAGRTPVAGRWVDEVNGIDGVRVEIVMMRTPDGHSQVELTKFAHPAAIAAPDNGTPNVLGLRSIMFAVDDLRATVERLRAHGGELVGAIAQYEELYLLCYLRGPAGVIVALAEELRQ
jgi:catechol 2,3-dioxygenase-like lactoylglutathione lyase family enzyme